MSVLFLIAAWQLFQSNMSPEMDFFIAWALFSIADALWIGVVKR